MIRHKTLQVRSYPIVDSGRSELPTPQSEPAPCAEYTSPVRKVGDAGLCALKGHACNSAHAVRGPKHSVKKGKTSVLNAAEMRDLLASIDNRLAHRMRDRALIALVGYTLARVSAAVGMKVGDFYVQNRRG